MSDQSRGASSKPNRPAAFFTGGPMAAPAFPNVTSTAAPTASSFLDSGFLPPFPTNSFFQNYVLGPEPEYIHPYQVQVNASQLAISFPSQTATAQAIIQAFVVDLIFAAVEGLGTAPARIVSYDKLSVTFRWGQQQLTVPLVRGSPYLTLIYNSTTPSITSPFPVSNFTANSVGTKYKVTLSNGKTWLIYSSSPLNLTPSLQAAAPFTGVVRVAYLPPGQAHAESILDYYSPVYPTAGAISLKHFGMTLSWTATTWGGLDTSQLLMLSLPVHRIMMTGASGSGSATSSSSPSYPSCGAPPPPPANTTEAPTGSLSVQTLDGVGIGQVGTSWSLHLASVDIGWHSPYGLNSTGLPDIQLAVTQDINNLAPITVTDTYFFGKAVARAARLALIAEEVGLHDDALTAVAFVESSLTPWMAGTFAANAFLYDPTWGGIVAKTGAPDPVADFGNGIYNDHHYHYGYYLYAAAVLTKFKSSWGQQYKPQIYSLVRDIFTVSPADPYFTQLRHFDPFVSHSWASGLSLFADGRNQESTSEAVNAYYAISLVGMAFGDLSLASLGATIATFEVHGAQGYWHNRVNRTLYPAVYTAANRIVGVLWNNKRDSALWFAPAEDYTVRLGIQVLPVTPYTQRLFSKTEYAQELVAWSQTSPVGTTDAWNGFVWSLQALYDQLGALANVKALTAFDDGNSLSNLLWWVYSR